MNSGGFKVSTKRDWAKTQKTNLGFFVCPSSHPPRKIKKGPFLPIFFPFCYLKGLTSIKKKQEKRGSFRIFINIPKPFPLYLNLFKNKAGAFKPIFFSSRAAGGFFQKGQIFTKGKKIIFSKLVVKRATLK